MNLQEGTTLHNGQYCIIRPLGQGGFGITYLAEDTLLRRQVVIKEFFIGELCFRENETSKVTVLSEGGRKTVDHFRKKFFREAQIVAGLSHPNIITIHAVFEENNTAYYVMEYHPNGSLQDKLKELNGPMAEADALRYIRQVADALAYIHGQEVAEEKEGTMKKRSLRHLDVKPSNIMLNKRGEAVLIDFGLVKVYDEEGKPLSTHSSTLNGYSPRFSPMEQVFADNKTVFTPATDIYALGATLYNLLETEPPTINELSAMKGNLPFSETTSQPVRKAITEAMQLNAEDRPQSIAEFLKLLPQKAENDPSAVYKKGLSEGIALFQAGKYVEALSRFLMLRELHPGHRAEISEWMMKCTEKMSAQGGTLRRDPPVPPVPPVPPKPTPWFKIGGGALLLALLVALGFIFRPESCQGGGEEPQPVDTLAIEVEKDTALDTAEEVIETVEDKQEYRSAAEVVDDYADKLSAGKKLYNSKNYQSAVSHFQGMLAAYPSHAEEVRAWLSDSRSALENANYKQALAEGEQYYNDKNYTKALTHFTDMKEEYPTYYDALNTWIAKCQTAKEKAEQAKKPTNSSVSSSGSRQTFTVNGVSFTMVRVEGGTFRMGATSEQVNPYNDEKPVHSVTLSSYSIGQTEVTQALWKAVMGSNPSRFRGDNLPVERVSWNDCRTFIRKLNALTGRTFRLPTEAEWEFAARGGNQSQGYQYSGSNNLGSVAWYDSNSGDKTHPVATKSANELGLYDMSGNVWEWCQDWYGSYSSSSQTNP
ncbi:MAG: SUMF1/EgtB/PvdO family nonheme iron enzyme, partial [Bacteroidaceae bacterium]|nr:SUMF1/EgtB/PvdO family nonheme iron enzyme [Bacteroidaceae bacterium]